MRVSLHLCTHEKIEEFQLLKFEDPHTALVWMGKRAEGRIMDGAIDGREGGEGEGGGGGARMPFWFDRPTDFHSLRGIFQSLNRKEGSAEPTSRRRGQNSQKTLHKKVS